MKIPRRQFILDSAGLVLGSMQLLTASSSFASAKRAHRNKVLVMVQLAGGNDGLNTVIPYGAKEYYAARPTLAVAASRVLPLSGAIGLSPQLASLYELYKRGQLAVLLGVGYPNPSRSHFRSAEIWQTAQPEKIVETGWLARYLEHSGELLAKPNPDFPAINVDPMLPKSLASDRIFVPSIPQTNHSPDAHDQLVNQGQLEAFNRIFKSFDLARVHPDLLDRTGLKSICPSGYPSSSHLAKISDRYRDSVKYPENGFGRGMKFIAQMIITGLETQIYNISLGGFDTHSNQNQTHPELLLQLSESLAAFYRDLESHKKDQDVILLACSEFGRRLHENEERGTDHGTASPVFVLGRAVKGGLYGQYPSLLDLEQNDLKHNLDFRTVYATILERWLGTDSKAILGDDFGTLDYV